MTTEVAEPSPAPPAAVATKTPWQRIAGVLFSPAETFADIARRPDILVPLLLLIVCAYIGTAIVLPRMDWDAAAAQQAEAMRAQKPDMSQEDIDQAARITKSIGTVVGWTIPVLMIAWYAMVAGVLLIAFRLFGGEGNYKQAFSATLYSWMPMLLGSLIGAIVVLTRSKIDPMEMATLVKSSPAFLVDMKTQPVLFSLLSSIDLFTIWTIVLLIFGFAALARMTRAKAAAIVIPLWLVIIVIKLGFAAMSAAKMKAT